MKHFTQIQDACPNCGSDHLTDPTMSNDGVTTCNQCEEEWTCDSVEFERVEGLELDDILAA